MRSHKIVSTPGTCGGAPRLDGTRMPVWSVIAALAEHGIPGVIEQYPGITPSRVRACVRYAMEAVGYPTPAESRRLRHTWEAGRTPGQRAADNALRAKIDAGKAIRRSKGAK